MVRANARASSAVRVSAGFGRTCSPCSFPTATSPTEPRSASGALRRVTRRTLSIAIAATLLLGAAEALAAGVGVTTALEKVRPMDAVPAQTSASIEAARNEFEPFQIVVGGSASGVSAQVSDLVGPGGAVVPAGEITLYRAGLYEVATPSNTEGAMGLWPDPLVPDVDAYYGEKRNAFPFDVPAGEVRSIWVEVFVPKGTPPGTYSGEVLVAGDGVGSVSVPVSLRVRNFELPSTSSLKTAFGMGWNAGCVAHHGSYEACGFDEGIEHFHTLYGRAALDHRISLETLVYYYGDTDHFDAVYGDLMGGTADTRLEGARQTTLRLHGGDTTSWQDHFDAQGWGTHLFDYTCDEPPHGCDWSDITAKAPDVQAQGIQTLVTVDLDSAKSHGLVDDIDILVPLIQNVDDKWGYDKRAEYDEFLAMGPEKELWWYQSCVSHGCGAGCVPTDSSYHTGWPSYMIDSSGVQNRAMEWLSYSYDMTGELYFETTWMLDSAWDTSCDFSGNGDGTLFYPGTPARIGGETDIPVESIRLKLIREGMEDYEYLVLLEKLGDEGLARDTAQTLFPKPYDVATATPEQLYAARTELADRIEALSGGSAPVDDGTTPSVDDGTTPSADDGTTPSTDDGTTPSTDDGTTPSMDDGTTPSTDDGTTPSTDDGSTPSTDDGSTPPKADRPERRFEDGNAASRFEGTLSEPAATPVEQGQISSGGCSGAGNDGPSGWAWLAVLAAALLMVTRRPPRERVRVRARRDTRR